MYEACFGFEQRPFSTIPNTELYFPATVIEDARETLARCIQRSEGIGMLVGPSGTGKTLLCRLLAEQFEETLATAVLSSGRLSTRRNLFQAILYELGRPYRGLDEGEARIAIVDYLTLDEECPEGMLLIVDEAHTLPLRLIEELRMLTNISRDGKPMVRLVLAGGCVLEERLANPRLDSFSQRIVGRCYLEPLNRSETEEYVQSIVEKCGGEGEELFDEEACRSVHQATDGVPRLINQLCDHTLLLVHADGEEMPTARDVEEAWADLQQLPAPANDECDASIIEFGGLEDQFEADELDCEQDSDIEHADDGFDVVEEESAGAQLRIDPQTSSSPSEADDSEAADLESGGLEPVEQIDRIEEALTGLDDEFQPAGTIGPEVELIFNDALDPFGERFEEEEVVADRYGEPGTAEPSIAQHMDTQPGDAEIESTEQRADHPQEVTAGIDTANAFLAEDGEVKHVAEDNSFEELAANSPIDIDAQLSEKASASQKRSDSQAVPMISLEEERKPAAVVPRRKQAYGRLFANLRRG